MDRKENGRDGKKGGDWSIGSRRFMRIQIDVKALKGILARTNYENGRLMDCTLKEENIFRTPVGKLIPRYRPPDIRSKDGISLSLYPDGCLKSISLDEQTEVETPLGRFPAELLTFYEDGALDSIFPLNGKLGFSWSEEEEKALAAPHTFRFPFGSFTAKVMGMRFYPGGELKSMILWTGEEILIDTPAGEIPARIGFRLYENGKIASVEPAVPVTVNTPAGGIKAFDTLALGMDADYNSLQFDREGRLASLKTSGDIFIHDRKNNKRHIISSAVQPGILEDELIKSPFTLRFTKEEVMISSHREESSYSLKGCSFRFFYGDSGEYKNCYGDCSGCKGNFHYGWCSRLNKSHGIENNQ